MHSITVTAVVFLTVSAFAEVAHAQSNTVSLGQVGNTNAIRIDQTGAANTVGAGPAELRLNQLGDGNQITILQFGNANVVGALDIGIFGPPQGLNQIGARNALDIAQTTGRIGGANMVGAIRQEAAAPLDPSATPVTNSLRVRQVGTGTDEAGDHFIGTIHQIYGGSGPQNVASLVQTGGGTGEGHRVLAVVQDGTGNRLLTRQSERGNALARLEQRGGGNEADLAQERGAGNFVGDLLQGGGLNRAEISQSGARNVVAEIRQVNVGRAVSGNSLTLVFAGDDNGGDGIGGASAFAGALQTVGAFDSAVAQIGDGNALSYTVGAIDSGTPNADGNRFGFLQDGTGNVLTGFASGDGNAAAVRQTGDGNVLDFTQDNSTSEAGNRIAVVEAGERNALSVAQSGSGNVAQVLVEGDDNRSTSGGLLPGGLLQSGTDNSITLDVVGDFNVFAVFQSGIGNVAAGVIAGSFNQAFVSQTGDNNLARFSQSGRGNSATIEQ